MVLFPSARDGEGGLGGRKTDRPMNGRCVRFLFIKERNKYKVV